MVIRAVYQHLIDNYRTRPYLPGLLRLMIKSLLLRGEWRLLQYLCSRAFQKKNSQQVLSNRDVAALVNYAISVSTKLRRGQKTVYNCTSLLAKVVVNNSVSICETGKEGGS